MANNIRFLKSLPVSEKDKQSKARIDALTRKILAQLERRYHCSLKVDCSIITQATTAYFITVLAMPAQEVM